MVKSETRDMNKILLSTGAFIGRRNGYDHSLITRLQPQLRYDGFEIFMFGYFADGSSEKYEPVVQDILRAKENGTEFYSMHMNKRIGDLISRNENDDIAQALSLFECDCDYAVQFGVRLLVLHLWGGLASDKNIAVNIGLFPKLKAIADRHRLLLTVENIVCNTHKPLEHMKKMWELYGRDVHFTIDVRQAEFHKSLAQTCESDFLWENDLVPHLHISDYSGGEMDWPRLGVHVPLGEGDVDFDCFFSFLKSVGFGGSVTVETSALAAGEDFLRELGKSYAFVRAGIGGGV